MVCLPTGTTIIFPPTLLQCSSPSARAPEPLIIRPASPARSSSSESSTPGPTIVLPLPPPPPAPHCERSQTLSPVTVSYQPSPRPIVRGRMRSRSPSMCRGRSPVSLTYRVASRASDSSSESYVPNYRRRSRSPVYARSHRSPSPLPVPVATNTNSLSEMNEILDNARRSVADVFSKLAGVNADAEKTTRSCADQKARQDQHDDVLKKALASFREKQSAAERSIKDLVEKRDRSEKCLKENILLMLELKEKQDREIQSEMEALFSANKQFAADVGELLSGTSVPEGLRTVSPVPSSTCSGYRPGETYHAPPPAFNHPLPAGNGCQHQPLPTFGTERGASGPGASSCPHFTPAPLTPWTPAGHCWHHGPTGMPPNHTSAAPPVCTSRNAQPSHPPPIPRQMPPQLSTITPFPDPPQFRMPGSYTPSWTYPVFPLGTGRPPCTVSVPSVGPDSFMPPSSQGERRGSPTPSFLTGPLSGPLGSAGKVDRINKLADQLAFDRIIEAQRACHIFDKSAPGTSGGTSCPPAPGAAKPAVHIPFSPSIASKSSVQASSPVYRHSPLEMDPNTCKRYEPPQPFAAPNGQQAESSHSSAASRPLPQSQQPSPASFHSESPPPLDSPPLGPTEIPAPQFRTLFAFDGQDHAWFQPSGPTLSPPVPQEPPVAPCLAPASSQWVRFADRELSFSPETVSTTDVASSDRSSPQLVPRPQSQSQPQQQQYQSQSQPSRPQQHQSASTSAQSAAGRVPVRDAPVGWGALLADGTPRPLWERRNNARATLMHTLGQRSQDPVEVGAGVIGESKREGFHML
ncbi:hypothetical protein DENSPDRAFT_209417 [Dentipellis sp. KUC8613]|nr:hypothetical protein DENSPDRAFT_209417 [Dentipellis sp. KUC8613]